jgi:hypothetical protein
MTIDAFSLICDLCNQSCIWDDIDNDGAILSAIQVIEFKQLEFKHIGEWKHSILISISDLNFIFKL